MSLAADMQLLRRNSNLSFGDWGHGFDKLVRRADEMETELGELRAYYAVGECSPRCVPRKQYEEMVRQRDTALKVAEDAQGQTAAALERERTLLAQRSPL